MPGTNDVTWGQESGSSATTVHINFTTDSLQNGLTVLYHVDRSAPVVAVNVWYNVGSKHEQPGKTGFAHLFEHMMFKGSRNVPDGAHWSMLEAVGARGGADVNGTTAHDRTNYFETVPSNHLALALWLEAERMGTLLEALTQAKLDNQREVVKNELLQNRGPYGDWYEVMLAGVFPEGHPYHHTIAGSMSDLDRATLDDVRAFFSTYYSPNNAVLVVAGDIDIARARTLVHQHFGGIARRPSPTPLPDMKLPALIGREQRVVIPDTRATTPAVYLGYRVPAARDSGGPAAVILAGMLGEGRSSLLHERLVRSTGVATSANGFAIWLVDGADLLVVSAEAAAGITADSLERALVGAVTGSLAVLTQEALDRVRAGLRFGFVNGLQSMGGFGGRADRLAEGHTYFRDPNWVNTRMSRFDAVTLEDVRHLATEQLRPLNRV
ncbi:MAG: insulinase family protein, partial [Anaerolineae bacterium]|nr:insulinase family protein [Gemmatimonadaceae bacterium]